MANPIRNASIRQLMVMLYWGISVPGIIALLTIIASLDQQVEYIQKIELVAVDTKELANCKGPWLTAAGCHLRLIEAPFSVSPALEKAGAEYHPIALNLSDFRAGFLYLNAQLFFISAVLVLWLSRKMQQPLKSLTQSIAQLSRNQLVIPIDIQGPINIREMGEGLEKLRLRLKDNQQHQNQFLRHISHEIKTPLTSIKEGSKLLEDEILGALNNEQREVTDILNKSTAELQTSIENLLNYNSAISSDKIKQRQTLNLLRLVNEVIEKHALTVRNKGLIVLTDCSFSPAFVDRTQILTVFDNLLSNAIKYSPEKGEINISLKQNSGKAVFTISDQGPGVKEQHRKFIFDAFYVGDQSTKTTLKGTGLGLSIARQYVALHRGKIELLETRKGATFQVTLLTQH